MSDEEVGSKRLRSNSMRNGSQPSAKEMSVAELATLMTSQLSTYQRSTKDEIKRLGDKLEKLTTQMEGMKSEISADIQKLREEFNGSLSELAGTVEKNKVNTTQAMESVARKDDLIVSGVPYIEGENLNAYFYAWCRALGYKDENFPLVDVRRLSSRRLENSSGAVILIQFAFSAHRNDFYSRYMRTRTLSLSTIGFSVDKRIFVNENLGPVARNIRSIAVKLKKEGKLRSVISRNGVVCVKCNSDDREVPVSSIEDLELLIGRK